MSTAVMKLQPLTTPVDFTSRSAMRVESRASSIGSSTSKENFRRGPAKPMSAIPALSVIEIEALLRDKIKYNHQDLLKAFETYDPIGQKCVTEGEFRRVLETFCFSVTTEQFQAIINKVPKSPTGAVRYEEFLKKFLGRDIVRTPDTGTSSEAVERMVKEKIWDSLRNVQRALQMYDYNRDSHIQRSDLRKVLETCGCRLTDDQYDRFYRGFDLQRRGLVNYKEMMRRLGFPSSSMPAKSHDNYNNNNKQPLMKIETTPTHHSTVFQKPKDELKNMTLDQIEVQFRQKMQANFADLKKMFMAFDKKLTGFVSVQQLKSILCQFTLPMNDDTFQQVMQRCGVKASSNVAWEAFLDKFQPAYSGKNGQTIPIKPAHKWNPIRGVEQTKTLGEFIKLLDNHVNNAHGSFKKAFLEMDKKRLGYVSPKDLRRIINSFQIKLTDGQFKELMNILDPDQSGQIGYHHFLDLFEPRENMVTGHKWLTSVHRYNDQQKPAVLAWDTIEELIQGKLESNWTEFTHAVAKYDAKGTGWMSAKSLRKILEIFCLPLSDEHYEAMTNGMRNDKGQVFYPMLMKGLGVNPHPGDTEGLSTQIYLASLQERERHIADQGQREVELVANAHHRTKLMSSSEVIVRLRDRVTQHQAEFRKAFSKYDLQKKSRVTKKDFRRMLESFGYYMEDDQFKELCSSLMFNGSHMTYHDFIINFQDLGAYAPSYAEKPSNHIVYPIRGDQIGMTALQVEAKLRNKLRQNFEDLRGAFYKFDEHHRGYLTKSSFRRMLDSFMCILSDEEFEKLCAKLNLTKESKVSYKDFLDAFEIRDTAEGHKWTSDHRFNEAPPVQLMSAEEVHAILAQKAHQAYSDLSKAFTLFSDKETGQMKRDHLRRMLYNMVVPISRPQFNRLWRHYDADNKGFLTHEDFLRVAGEQFAPGDGGGMSHQIIQGSVDWLADHHAGQQIKHHINTINQAKQSTLMSVDEVMKQLTDRLRDQYHDLQAAFNKFDRRKRGELTVTDIQRMLIDIHFLLDDEQMFDLKERLGFSSTKRGLTYEDFLRAFQEGRSEDYEKSAHNPPHPSMKGPRGAGLTVDEAELKLRQIVTEKTEVLRKAFQSFDVDQTGYIKAADFKQVLDNFVFKLSDVQFKRISESLAVQGDGYVYYTAFLSNFTVANLDAREWLIANQQQGDSGLALLSLDELQEKLTSLVTTQFPTVARAFADADYARIGVISQDDFRNILNEFEFFITTEQFQNLWNIQKVNDFGNLEYHEFLRKYCAERGHFVRPDSRLVRPRTSQSQMGGRNSRLNGLSRSVTSLNGAARPYTPLVNAEGAESRLQTLLLRHWRDMEKICREMDPEHSGSLDPVQFTEVLSRLRIHADDEDLDKLLLKYDLNNNGLFCYREFLKNVAMGRSQSRLLPSRQKSSLGQQDLHSSVESRLTKCIQENWKPVRKQLRSIDAQGTGKVLTEDLREVLRQHQLNCTEDEFYSVLQKYEKGSDHVDYNIFIKDFLK